MTTKKLQACPCGKCHCEVCGNQMNKFEPITQDEILEQSKLNHPRDETYPDDHIRETFVEGAKWAISELKKRGGV